MRRRARLPKRWPSWSVDTSPPCCSPSRASASSTPVPWPWTVRLSPSWGARGWENPRWPPGCAHGEPHSLPTISSDCVKKATAFAAIGGRRSYGSGRTCVLSSGTGPGQGPGRRRTLVWPSAPGRSLPPSHGSPLSSSRTAHRPAPRSAWSDCAGRTLCLPCCAIRRSGAGTPKTSSSASSRRSVAWRRWYRCTERRSPGGRRPMRQRNGKARCCACWHRDAACAGQPLRRVRRESAAGRRAAAQAAARRRVRRRVAARARVGGRGSAAAGQRPRRSPSPWSRLRLRGRAGSRRVPGGARGATRRRGAAAPGVTSGRLRIHPLPSGRQCDGGAIVRRVGAVLPVAGRRPCRRGDPAGRPGVLHPASAAARSVSERGVGEWVGAVPRRSHLPRGSGGARARQLRPNRAPPGRVHAAVLEPPGRGDSPPERRSPAGARRATARVATRAASTQSGSDWWEPAVDERRRGFVRPGVPGRRCGGAPAVDLQHASRAERAVPARDVVHPTLARRLADRAQLDAPTPPRDTRRAAPRRTAHRVPRAALRAVRHRRRDAATRDHAPRRYLALRAEEDGFVAMNWEAATNLGVRRFFPFFNRDVIELAFECHPTELVGPGTKKLLRRALRQDVPQHNLERPDKGGWGSYVRAARLAWSEPLPEMLTTVVRREWYPRPPALVGGFEALGLTQLSLFAESLRARGTGLRLRPAAECRTLRAIETLEPTQQPTEARTERMPCPT